MTETVSLRDLLEIFRTETGVAGDPGKHPRPYLFPIMEREHEVGLTFLRQDPVRSALTLDAPADFLKGSKHAARASPASRSCR